jgi:thiol-disulfide isomerase/thioredoxin
MSYTRLSMNFQPKTAQYPRRRFLSASLAAWASCHSLAMVPALAASNSPDARAAPPMTHAITDENDTSFTLQTLRGRPLLINFWASWCAPCIAEMPSLQKAAEQLHPDGIDVLLISIDRGGRQKAVLVLQSRGVTAPRFGFDPRGGIVARNGGGWSADKFFIIG